jgi:hypothetical protein
MHLCSDGHAQIIRVSRDTAVGGREATVSSHNHVGLSDRPW